MVAPPQKTVTEAVATRLKAIASRLEAIAETKKGLI